jgi:hypothetical protein
VVVHDPLADDAAGTEILTLDGPVRLRMPP